MHHGRIFPLSHCLRRSARRARERRKKARLKGKRTWLWLKVMGIVVLLLTVAVFGVAAGALYALTRNLPSLDSLKAARQPLNTTITTAAAR